MFYRVKAATAAATASAAFSVDFAELSAASIADSRIALLIFLIFANLIFRLI
jgi:hypothetical protein